MNTTHWFSCPNCGGTATRRYFTSKASLYNCCPNGQVTQTECLLCDYLMTMCSLNGQVIRGQTSAGGITLGGPLSCDRERKPIQIIPLPRKLSASL